MITPLKVIFFIILVLYHPVTLLILCAFMLWLIALLISVTGLLVGEWGMWVWCVGVCVEVGVGEGVCEGVCVEVCGGRYEVFGCVCVCAKRVFVWMLFNGFLSFVDMGVSEINRLIGNFVSYIIYFAILILFVSLIVKLL